jgi:hypothetical protein
LTSCQASVNYLDGRQQIALLVSLAQAETDAAARQGYLSVLFRSPPAMWCLMEAGQYEALETLISSIQDPLQQAVLFGDFLQTEGVVQEVIERKQESKLLEYAQQVPAPDAKREYLPRLFRSPSIARRLIDLGHFPALFALADQEADSASRTVLLAAFFANPVFVRQLAERRELAPLVRFVQQDGVADSRRPILELLGKDATAVHVLVETGQIEAILVLCGQEKKGGDRASLLVELLRSPRVVQYFADRSQWDSYLDWLRRAHDADSDGFCRTSPSVPKRLFP